MSAAKAMPEPVRFRFGSYVIDSEKRCLLENDTVLTLQPKPFMLLEALVRRHGQIVRREDLAKVLWPDTFVQVDQGLNAAVKKVRSVLQDDPKSPRYIETLGSRGYRFICPVEVLGWSKPTPVGGFVAESSPVPLEPASVLEQIVRARYQLAQNTRGSILKAIELFREAAQSEPTRAHAFAGLANAYMQMADMNLVVPRGAYELSLASARRAAELDPNLVDAMVPLGWSTLLLHRDWKGARGWMERALEVNPRHAAAFTVLGRLEMMRGHREEALALIRHARYLSPLSVMNNTSLAQFLYYSVDFESAASHAMQILEMNHGAQMMVLPVLCCSLLALGRTREAVTLLSAQLGNEDETYPALPALATALAHEGKMQDAEATVQKAERDTVNRPPSSYMLSFAYRALGNREQAENWMVRAIHERSHLSLYLAVDPHAQDYTDFVGVKPWMEWLRHLAAT
jgi:DNA-binding winged helix-turn-helix (wHTH) protein/Flp pilus assembly protein TadD